MKEIAGINLAELVQAEDASIIAERRAEVSKQIRGIILNIHQWTAANVDMERQLKKNTDRIEGAKAKLAKIQGGDWSVLEEKQQQGGKGKEAIAGDVD